MPRNLFQMLQQEPPQQQPLAKKQPFQWPQELLDSGHIPIEGSDPGELEAAAKQLLAMQAQQQPQQRPQLPMQLPPMGSGMGAYLPSIKKQKLAGEASSDMMGTIGGSLSKTGRALAPLLGEPMEQETPKPQAAPMQGPPQDDVAVQGQRQPGDFLRELDAQDAQARESSAQGFGQFVPPGITEAVQDSVRQYGIAEQDYQKAELALKKEFQDTPEIDEALSKAKLSLTQAQMQRKQATAMDYIAMALMNLSGVPPQTSAAMVLGLDDQARREDMLEGRVMGLEDAKISGRMQGRRDYRSMQARGASEEAERQFKMSEIMRDQSNKDRDFSFKQQDQMADLMRALAGQEGETERGSLDDATRKKSAASRDLMKRLLQVDDRALQEMLRQRQQPQQPQDKRQSRMFGSLIGDQFA